MANYHATRLIARTLAVLVAACLAACTEKKASDNSVSMPAPRSVAGIIEDIELLSARYDHETKQRVEALNAATARFLDAPNEATRSALQSAWLHAHTAFAATRVLVFSEERLPLIFRIDAWPMEPGFLDSLPRYPDSGIVNDYTLSISLKTLEEQHGITDTNEVSLGFHPLEYYAFVRPLEDFATAGEGTVATERVERRRRMVELIARELEQSIARLTDNRPALSTATAPNANAPAVVHTIVAASQANAHRGFQQASLIVDQDQGHCAYSQSSFAVLRQEATVLRQLYATDSTLMNVLSRISPVTAHNLDATLAQLTEALREESPDESSRAKLPIMWSAISHQLGDLARMLR